jgi:hypothetical protein
MDAAINGVVAKAWQGAIALMIRVWAARTVSRRS